MKSGHALFRIVGAKIVVEMQERALDGRQTF